MPKKRKAKRKPAYSNIFVSIPEEGNATSEPDSGRGTECSSGSGNPGVQIPDPQDENPAARLKNLELKIPSTDAPIFLPVPLPDFQDAENEQERDSEEQDTTCLLYTSPSPRDA